MSGLDLRGAEISGVIVATNGRLTYRAASLTGTDLRGTDLESMHSLLQYDDRGSNSFIERADFHGALANSSTQWPSGFDWRAAGVKLG